MDRPTVKFICSDSPKDVHRVIRWIGPLKFNCSNSLKDVVDQVDWPIVVALS